METNEKITIILGYGQIGIPICRLLAEKGYKIGIVDLASGQTIKNIPNVDTLHICIPYNKNFIENCLVEIAYYLPELIIIHSTIPVGTTRKIYKKFFDNFKIKINIVHSPIRGVHPNLYLGIKTFTKYIGPINRKSKDMAIKHFETLGLQTYCMKNPEDTELAKLLSTTYYGWNIIFNKEVQRLCKKYGTNFDDVYIQWNDTYNYGYKKLRMDNVVRPILNYIKGKIGGHCIIPNCEILKNDSGVAKFIIKYNESL